jgi:hypothetical protein
MTNPKESWLGVRQVLPHTPIGYHTDEILSNKFMLKNKKKKTAIKYLVSDDMSEKQRLFFSDPRYPPNGSDKTG